MRVAVLSREYPPEVYGGAGVHVEFLVRELRRLVDVDVHCFGAPRDEAGVHAYRHAGRLAEANARCAPSASTSRWPPRSAARTCCTRTPGTPTWPACSARQLHGVPHVLTAHSLEPQRPWKAEQLGGGYRISSWAERQAYETADAIVAVSYGMRADVLDAYPFVDPARVHVIHNGIDTDAVRARPRRRRARPARHRPRPAVRRSSSGGSPGRRAWPTCCARGRALRPGDPARAVRRRAGHRRDRGRDRGGGRAGWRPRAPGSSGSARCCRATSSPSC